MKYPNQKRIELKAAKMGTGESPEFSRYGVKVDPAHCEACLAYIRGGTAFQAYLKEQAQAA